MTEPASAFARFVDDSPYIVVKDTEYRRRIVVFIHANRQSFQRNVCLRAWILHFVIVNKPLNEMLFLNHIQFVPFLEQAAAAARCPTDTSVPYIGRIRRGYYNLSFSNVFEQSFTKHVCVIRNANKQTTSNTVLSVFPYNFTIDLKNLAVLLLMYKDTETSLLSLIYVR